MPEAAVTGSLSAGVEYPHPDTGNIDAALVGPFTVAGRVQRNVVRAALNLRLAVARWKPCQWR